MNRKHSAFTLIELLVVVTIIGVLVGIGFMLMPGMVLKGHQAASLNNLRQMGSAFQTYASDHDLQLPRRVEQEDKWPRLLNAYIGDTRIYADPEDKNNYILKKTDPLNNGRNNTSYFMNGFNDVGAFADSTVVVRINQVDQPSNTILMAPNSGSGHYYMDFAESNNTQILNKTLYGKGSNYLFMDGSARFIAASDYDDELWLIHKDEGSSL